MLIFKGFFMHFFKNSACFLYLFVVYWISKMRKDTNTMKTIISSILITLGLIMMAGAAGDCDGKCVENANSLGTMIFLAFTGLITFVSGGLVAIKQ